ncbi:hypothetical protein QAD02_016304 [Eretmocerus hayati]|uniref:Uncharacterized protein n=1 Tax=Eretmocerus hayati TaxID=131215 RepID=A0ACC2PDI9_9HYME|nr:hypothetical protein QAD02_016304 [Eretmocerus hayati]
MDHLQKQIRQFTSRRVMKDRGDTTQQRPSIEGVLYEHNNRPGDSTPIGGPRSPNGCQTISTGLVTDTYLYPTATTIITQSHDRSENLACTADDIVSGELTSVEDVL